MTADLTQRLIEHITDTCAPIDREQRFRDMLNECYDFKSVGGPFASMDPARVLEEMDPIAFRCGVNDYCDDDTYEIEGDTYDTREVDDARQEFIEQLEGEISDLESEIEEAEASRDEWVDNVGGDDDEQNRTIAEWEKEFTDDAQELAELNTKLAALQAELTACEKCVL